MVKKFVKKSKLEEAEDSVKPKLAAEMGDSKKKVKAKAKPEIKEEPCQEIETDNEEIVLDIEDETKELLSEASKTTASYQIQIRVPADAEPLYKGLNMKVRKALKNAFVQLIYKAANK